MQEQFSTFDAIKSCIAFSTLIPSEIGNWSDYLLLVSEILGKKGKSQKKVIFLVARLLRGRGGKGRATKKKGLFLKFIFDKKKFLWQRTKNFFCGFPKKKDEQTRISARKKPQKNTLTITHLM